MKMTRDKKLKIQSISEIKASNFNHFLKLTYLILIRTELLRRNKNLTLKKKEIKRHHLAP
jgi:hypothetical protein